MCNSYHYNVIHVHVIALENDEASCAVYGFHSILTLVHVYSRDSTDSMLS